MFLYSSYLINPTDLMLYNLYIKLDSWNLTLFYGWTIWRGLCWVIESECNSSRSYRAESGRAVTSSWSAIKPETYSVACWRENGNWLFKIYPLYSAVKNILCFDIFAVLC